MAKPAYKILELDTTAARAGSQIIPVGERFDGLRILTMPAGLALFLNWNGGSDSAHNVPLNAGDSVRFLDDCERPFYADEGLTITHNAVVGILRIYVSQGVIV